MKRLLLAFVMTWMSCSVQAGPVIVNYTGVITYVTGSQIDVNSNPGWNRGQEFSGTAIFDVGLPGVTPVTQTSNIEEWEGSQDGFVEAVLNIAGVTLSPDSLVGIPGSARDFVRKYNYTGSEGMFVGERNWVDETATEGAKYSYLNFNFRQQALSAINTGVITSPDVHEAFAWSTADPLGCCNSIGDLYFYDARYLNPQNTAVDTRIQIQGRLTSFIVSNQVPVPSTFALFGLGLAGLGWLRRKWV